MFLKEEDQTCTSTRSSWSQLPNPTTDVSVQEKTVFRRFLAQVRWPVNHVLPLFAHSVARRRKNLKMNGARLMFENGTIWRRVNLVGRCGCPEQVLVATAF